MFADIVVGSNEFDATKQYHLDEVLTARVSGLITAKMIHGNILQQKWKNLKDQSKNLCAIVIYLA